MRTDEMDPRRGSHDRVPGADTGIGDTNEGTGTLRPTDDVGTGGSRDFGGIGDPAGTRSIRTGQIGAGGIRGTRTGDVGPTVGVDTGSSEAMRGGAEDVEPPARPAIERPDWDASAPTLVEEAMQRRGDEVAGGTNAKASLGVAGVPTTGSELGNGDQGTADLGAAATGDVGTGLGGVTTGATGTGGYGGTGMGTSVGTGGTGAGVGGTTDIGEGLGRTRGGISGVGGTRGSGAGTGHVDDVGPTGSTEGTSGLGS